jgi:hypothetical protein
MTISKQPQSSQRRTLGAILFSLIALWGEGDFRRGTKRVEAAENAAGVKHVPWRGPDAKQPLRRY